MKMAASSAVDEDGFSPLQHRACTVTVVINCYNDLHFLPQAIDSVLGQTRTADEVIVVDDGSTDDPAVQLACFPELKLIRQANAGLATARNTGLKAASGMFILFLDADDRLLPDAIKTNLAALMKYPAAGLAYGGHRRIDATGPIGENRFDAVGDNAYLDLLQGNVIAMHATVLYRTERLRVLGGFDQTLRRCEDYDLYLRFTREMPIACHPTIIAEYRWHEANMSHAVKAMLDTVLLVHSRHAGSQIRTIKKAWQKGRMYWREYYSKELWKMLLAEWAGARRMPVLTRTGKDLLMASPGWVGRLIVHNLIGQIRGRLRRKRKIKLGHVKLGDLGSVRPISDDFGWDRGRPIDRYYIEGFLARNAADIRGAVMEVGDDEYSRRFGKDRIARQDILHVNVGNPKATIVGDLTDSTAVRDSSFDCIVLTQTLHIIWDFRLAIRRLHDSLKPGGVVLLTVPGISQIDRGEWGGTWFWSFTHTSITRLFEEVFDPSLVTVEHHGNVFAATAYLHGLAVEEVDTRKLEIVDDVYQVIIAVRAQKALDR